MDAVLSCLLYSFTFNKRVEMFNCLLQIVLLESNFRNVVFASCSCRRQRRGQASHDWWATHDPRALRTVLDIHSTVTQTHHSSNKDTPVTVILKECLFFTVGHIAQVCSLVSSFHSSVVHAYARGLSRLGSLPPIFSHPPMIMRQYSPRLIMASQARMSKVSRAYCRPLFTFISSKYSSTLDLSWISLACAHFFCVSATLFC
jgi:hypothetical protein